MARVLFERKPYGPALGALTIPRARLAPAPLVVGSNLGTAPDRHVSPASPHSGFASSRDYRAMMLAEQRRVTAGLYRSTH